MIYIFSPKKAAALERFLASGKKITWVEVLHHFPSEGSIREDDQIYLDITGLSAAEIKKALTLLKKSFTFWGIMDPKGEAPDPASFFFGGAFDYIGPALVKKGLDKKRFTAALSSASERFVKSKDKTTGKKPAKKGAKTVSAGKKKDAKPASLSAGKFEGWKSIRTGSTNTFLFLFVTLSGKSNLHSMMGEAAFNALKRRLRETIQQFFREADALLWMETEDDCLFLVPPRVANSRAAVEAILKILVNSRLIGLENFHLPFPVEFTFAFHYGKTVFQEPGKTGSIISEPVNYIFHLGARKAETGRLTVSDDVPEDTIPEGLHDLFVSAGEFEGISLRHSKRFVYK